MATLSFSFDTGSVPLSTVVDRLAAYYYYDANKLNGETKAQFIKRMEREELIRRIKQAGIRAARETADAGVAEINLN